jgi:hypothetical protein
MVLNYNAVVIYCATAVIYCGILTVENEGTAVNYFGIFFIKLPLGGNIPPPLRFDPIAGNTKGGSIIVLLTSCLTGLD